MKNLAILGSTGSIGVNTLNVIRDASGAFNVTALAAGQNIALLKKQIEEFNPQIVAVANEEHAERLIREREYRSDIEVLYGLEGYRRVAMAEGADTVVSAMSGIAGFLPTLDAIDAGRDIALANKELLVIAGNILKNRVIAGRAQIMPIDSEHSAIFQCIQGHRHADIRRIILTASGGPFINLSLDDLLNVTPAQALNHPRWTMGKGISVDSATLMNKGKEIIEARWLFDIDFEKIHVHIHPQSIIHSMVEYIDGSIIAQMGIADMKIPIAYALTYPERFDFGDISLDLLSSSPLEFFAPDLRKFPSIRLALEAGKIGGTMPAVLNAANDEAVSAFLAAKIKFTQITFIIEEVLSLHSVNITDSIDEILLADHWARDAARVAINNI